MKIVTKSIILLLILSISLSNSSRIKSKNTFTVQGAELTEDAKKKLASYNLQLPADYIVKNPNPVITEKAKKQTEAARNLFKNPNPIVKKILTAAALQLRNLLSKNLSDKALNDEKLNRSIYGGVLTKNFKENQKNKLGDQAKISKRHFQTGRISKVAKDTTDATEFDRAGAVALMGDIGTSIFDCEMKRDGSGTFEDNGYCSVEQAIAITHKRGDRLKTWKDGQEAKKQRGGSAIAKMKKDTFNAEKKISVPGERGMKFGADSQDNTGIKDKNGKDIMKFKERSNILSTKVDGSGWSGSWPWQMMPEAYLKNCAEPFAGHYSGSIVEILFVLDLLTETDKDLGKDEPLKSYVFEGHPAGADLDSDIRKCKAAIGAAFLLSVGYHSAIEVKPTIWGYLGKGEIGKNPQIFSLDNQKCDVSATDDIVNLMKGCTA